MRQRKKRILGVNYAFVTAFVLTSLLPTSTILVGATNVETASGGAVQVVTPTAAPKPTATPKETTEKKTKKSNWKVKKKKVSHPKKLTCGVGFNVKGTLVSSRKMKYVVAEIQNEEGDTIYKTKEKVNKKKFSLSKVDEELKFSELKKGDYVYSVTAVDKKKTKKEVVNDEFTVKKAKWGYPVNGGIMGDGWHCHCSYHGGRHYGWDIKGTGKPIHAVSDGTVVYAKYHGGSSLGSFGKLVIIYHGNGIYSYYAHCSKIKTKVGKKVEQGDVIGNVGSTGLSTAPHLHLELRKGPAFKGSYNSYKLVDKYTYKQFNPGKKIKVK